MNLKLYNEWKKSFLNELNNRLINLSNNKDYYDITDSDKLLIVHNTHFPINVSEKMSTYLVSAFKSKINYYQRCNKTYISLSIQDKAHHDFYTGIGERGKTVKFVYGKLNSKDVGIIYPDDAHTYGFLMSEDFNSIDGINEFYTVDIFMNNTVFYNELTYKNNDNCYLPKAILCEDEISIYEREFADILGVPILYRKHNKFELDTYMEREKRKVKMFVNPYCKKL